MLLYSSLAHFGVYIAQLPLRSASLLPSVLILSAVLTSAKRVALNMTVPSLFSGIFMETRRCGIRRKRTIIFWHGLNCSSLHTYDTLQVCHPSQLSIHGLWVWLYDHRNMCHTQLLSQLCSEFALGSLSHCWILFSSMWLSISTLCFPSSQ